MSDTVLNDTLLDLVVQYGLPTVLRALAHTMADMGAVTGGLVSEVAGVEAWLQQLRAERNDNLPPGLPPAAA
jgi:hypothetical protein